MALQMPDATDAAAAEKYGPAMFGAVLPAAQKYAELLAGPGVERGIVGPAEAERIWERHLLNCGAVARLIPVKSSVVDLGSGAGLPGIVLAMLLPQARITLLEPMARRVEFLTECVTGLDLGNAEVVRGRAEDLAGQLAADVVTARAVAPLDKLVGLMLGLLRPGGKALAIKGSSAEAELARALPVLTRLGVTDARVVHAGGAGGLGGADGAPAATVVSFSAPAHRAGTGRNSRPDGRAARPGVRAGYSGGPAVARKRGTNTRRSGG
jgi:16S rRNA (guanine527-N7)-methyltransferase